MKRRKSVAALTACVGVIALALAGCSSGGTTAGSDIVVAELFPMTGKIAFVGDALLHGAKVGIAEVNAAGGVLGHKLVGTIQDDAGDTVDAVPAWHALQVHNPTFELGPTVFTAPSVIHLYDSAQLPDFMVAGATTYDQMNYKYVFRTTPSDSTQAYALAAYAVAQKYMHAAIIFDNGQNSQTFVSPLVKAYEAHGGTITYNASVVPLQTSYQTELERVFATHPDAVFFQTDPQTAGTIFHQMESLGYLTVPIIATDNGASIDFANAMGLQNASKWMTGMAGAIPSGPAATAYVAGYDKLFHTQNPLDLSQNTYDAVVIASLAMEAAKSTKPSVWLPMVTTVSNPPGTKCFSFGECKKLVDQGKDINYEGASGSQDFNQYHNVFGDWSVVQFGMDKQLKTLYTVTAATVQQYEKG